jgi:hypothetical protein
MGDLKTLHEPFPLELAQVAQSGDLGDPERTGEKCKGNVGIPFELQEDRSFPGGEPHRWHF